MAIQRLDHANRPSKTIFARTGMVFALLFVLGFAACRARQEPAPIPPALLPEKPPPVYTRKRMLTGAALTPEALARRFLELLAKGDRAGLRALRLTEEEFCQWVWPELESSRVPNLECGWAWQQATLRSEGGLYDSLPAHEGRRYELLSIRFAGVEAHHTYKIHKTPVLRIRDEKGEEREARLFGSMLEMDGQFKLFSFVVD